MAASLWSPVFMIGSLHIGNVEGASCINFGNNYPTGFVSNKKHNQGFGTVHGDGNHFRQGRHVVHDPDLIDLYAGQGALPEWLQEMMREEAVSGNSGTDKSGTGETCYTGSGKR